MRLPFDPFVLIYSQRYTVAHAGPRGFPPQVEGAWGLGQPILTVLRLSFNSSSLGSLAAPLPCLISI